MYVNVLECCWICFEDTVWKCRTAGVTRGQTRECARMRLNAAACASHVAGCARARIRVHSDAHPAPFNPRLSAQPSQTIRLACVCIQVGAERIQIEPYSGHAVFSAYSEVGG